MGDNTKILEDISTLTQICRSNSDGPTLKIEENEIKNKLSEYDEEIKEIKAIDADDSYDTSAEMADRNIEIITKKVIQATNSELKNKNAEMDSLKEKEAEYSNSLHSLKKTRISYEKYITSLKERLTSTTEDSVEERYNKIISNTETKIIKQDERIKEMEDKHSEVQTSMDNLHEEITNLEKKLEAKKALLAEAQNNLENKELYIDKAKKEKNNKRINEIETKKEELGKRLDEISKDPKYLEMKIKEILLEEGDNYGARNYIIELLTLASKVPYSDRYVDKKMEEELLAATQERDTFAREIDNKTYDIMDSISPEQIRVDFLNNRISYWQSEIKRLEERVLKIDKDEAFHYAEKNKELDELINKLKEETQDFKTRYEKESDANLSNKAILKITYEEKQNDLAAAEEISSEFRKNEAEDVEEAGRIVKQDIEVLNKKIKEAEEEIYQIKERLDHRKSGNKDLSAKNKDREKLESLAQVVIDIKHRRQFADRTYDIAKRLEFNLGMKLVDAVYSETERDKLAKEVMVPIEEKKEEEPVIENTTEVQEEKAIEEKVENMEVAVAEPSSELTVEEAVNEIPNTEEQEKTSSEESIPNTKEPENKTTVEESESPIKTVAIPSIAEAEPASENVEEQVPINNIVEEGNENNNSSIPETEEKSPMDLTISDFNPTIDNALSENVNTSVEIQENPPAEINKNTVEEVTIPDMPPLPDISSDDTTSIPVIPIAEPSTDDNFTISTTDNNEPVSSIETNTETTQESETN